MGDCPCPPWVIRSGTGSGTGGTVTLAYEYPVGLNVFSIGTGWVAGPWSRGTWGSSYSTGIGQQLRLWSNDNFGFDLVIAPRGAPVFYWKDSTGVSTKAQYLSTLANATTAVVDAATFLIGAASITVTAANAPYIYPYMVITGTGIPTGTKVSSTYITGSTTVPITSIITDLNIDMIGRSKPAGDTKPANKVLTGPDEVYVIGSKMQSTQLGQISEKVNAEYLKLAFNYKYDDPNDTERIFYRSDHYNYARKGIPIIFYFDGVHEDYHGLGDEVSKIDFQKMEKIVRTVYLTMWELSGLPKRPVVDKPLNR